MNRIMKKIIYLLIAMLMFSACRKDNHKEEEFLICCDTPCLSVKLQIKENLIPEDLLEKVAIYEETSEGKVKANIVYNFKKDGKEYKIKYFKKDGYVIFSFNVLHDMDRTFGDRIIKFSLEIPNNKPIALTFKGKYYSIPGCCSAPSINQAFLNDKEWKPLEEYINGTYEYHYILPEKMLEKEEAK